MNGTQPAPDASSPAVASAPLVEFTGLTVSYGPLVALSGVTGAFPAGPTGLLGPNGAGKTTLLKTLLGFLKPDAGRIVAFGMDPARDPLEVRRRIGYMPEVDCHVPGMTAAAFVGLGEARYRAVDTYSTGMKQRAKLAQALVHDPDLLLLDEPTNGLDPQGREEMLALIQDISRRRRMSLILCSHLLRDVEQVCDHVIVFNLGKVAARGPMAALTGPRRSVYDVRIKGEAAAFLTDLKDLGCEWRETEDGLRVFLAEGLGPEVLFKTAREAGVQVRYLRPGAESLEDVFLRALGHEVVA